MMGVSVPAYLWANEVKKLDGHRCAFCGSTDRLEAHHIFQRAVCEEEATDLENGITLCHKCHYTAHGANYTTRRFKGMGYRGFSTSPDTIRAFIEDYKSSKIVFAAPKWYMENIKAHADIQGESVNGFISRAISEQMQRDNEKG